jgi:hypothetical protein
MGDFRCRSLLFQFLEALTKPVQPFSLRKRHIRIRPHNCTDSARGIPKFTIYYLHLVNERGRTWCFSQFVTNLQEFAIACATAQKDPIWHCHVLASRQGEGRGEAESSSFYPFIMF